MVGEGKSQVSGTQKSWGQGHVQFLHSQVVFGGCWKARGGRSSGCADHHTCHYIRHSPPTGIFPKDPVCTKVGLSPAFDPDLGRVPLHILKPPHLHVLSRHLSPGTYAGWTSEGDREVGTLLSPKLEAADPSTAQCHARACPSAYCSRTQDAASLSPLQFCKGDDGTPVSQRRWRYRDRMSLVPC